MMKTKSTTYLEEMMNKFKIAALMVLVFGLTACQNENYVSLRHPEGEAVEMTDDALSEDGEMEEDIEENTEEEVAEEDTEEEVVEENTEEEQTPETSDSVMYTVGGVVNVRLAPSATSEIITTVSPGDELVKLGDSDNWSRVTVNGQTGYIRSDLLIAR